MIILGIETSCDETALALLDCTGTATLPHFKVLSEVIYSQIAVHEKFGGVFPMLAKREHAQNIVPLFLSLLEKAHLKEGTSVSNISDSETFLKNIGIESKRESEMWKQFFEKIPHIGKLNIDAIAVTAGPGLEPALWVGINFAKALGAFWNVPVFATNHMEGHITSVLLSPEITSADIRFPLIALLVSGGHTDLVLVEDWLSYKLLGQTRDDAVGEAFDKVARILGLTYPGGPKISKLAESARAEKPVSTISFPRPMMQTKDYDFSFSGLKTAVLYHVQKAGDLSEEMKADIAREFEDAAIEELYKKTKSAIEEYGAKTLIIGGGVVANKHLREQFTQLANECADCKLLIPTLTLSTDNAVMIAAAAYLHAVRGEKGNSDIRAKGTLKLAARFA